jgi:hypothetical protein
MNHCDRPGRMDPAAHASHTSDFTTCAIGNRPNHPLDEPQDGEGDYIQGGPQRVRPTTRTLSRPGVMSDDRTSKAASPMPAPRTATATISMLSVNRTRRKLTAKASDRQPSPAAYASPVALFRHVGVGGGLRSCLNLSISFGMGGAHLTLFRHSSSGERGTGPVAGNGFHGRHAARSYTRPISSKYSAMRA